MVRVQAGEQAFALLVTTSTIDLAELDASVGRTTPDNAADTEIIDRYDNPTGAVIIVRDGIDDAVLKPLLDALMDWKPKPDALYGPFKPYDDADVAEYFRDLKTCPRVTEPPRPPSRLRTC